MTVLAACGNRSISHLVDVSIDVATIMFLIYIFVLNTQLYM